jgi:hypothetical protein
VERANVRSSLQAATSPPMIALLQDSASRVAHAPGRPSRISRRQASNAPRAAHASSAGARRRSAGGQGRCKAEVRSTRSYTTLKTEGEVVSRCEPGPAGFLEVCLCRPGAPRPGEPLLRLFPGRGPTYVRAPIWIDARAGDGERQLRRSRAPEFPLPPCGATHPGTANHLNLRFEVMAIGGSHGR